MNKIKTVVTSVMAVAAVFLGVATLMVVAEKPPANTAIKGVETVKQVEVQPATELSFTATKGMTVLDQLKQQAKVETQDSAYGPFVSAINGVKGGAGGKYWSYYINGVLAQKGAADYITVGGEKITWKLE